MVTLEDALAYHDRGISVIPMFGNKKAAVPWTGFQERGPDEGTIRQWFGGDMRRAVAMVCGPPSGNVVVRDFDNMQAYNLWACKFYGAASELPTVATFRGRHVHARVDQAQIAGLGAYLKYGDGELRLRRCLSILPPSDHPEGVKYEWTVPMGDEIPVVDLNELGWLRATEQTETTEHTEDITLSTLSHEEIKKSLPPSASPVDFAIARCLPFGPGERNRRLFQLARELKGIPETRAATAKELKAVVRQWHAAALPRIRTKPFEDSFGDFVHAWESVKYAVNDGPIDGALARAITEPDNASCLQYDHPSMRLLVKLCRQLQIQAGADPFFLACRTAGRLVDVDHATAARWLHVLTVDEVLKVEQAGSQGGKKASRYRYIASE